LPCGTRRESAPRAGPRRWWPTPVVDADGDLREVAVVPQAFLEPAFQLRQRQVGREGPLAVPDGRPEGVGQWRVALHVADFAGRANPDLSELAGSFDRVGRQGPVADPPEREPPGELRTHPVALGVGVQCGHHHHERRDQCRGRGDELGVEQAQQAALDAGDGDAEHEPPKPGMDTPVKYLKVNLSDHATRAGTTAVSTPR
jgi:hypothetical protein